MPEYKPRRLGDSFASTTPSRGNAPPTQPNQLETFGQIFPVAKNMMFMGSETTAAAPSATVIRIVPLEPLIKSYQVHYGRVRVGTSSASNGAVGALYTLDNGILTKVDASQLTIPADTGSVAVTKQAAFTISKENQYFWVTGASDVTATYSVFNVDSASRTAPFYTKTHAGVFTSGLPATLKVSDLTKNYTSAGVTGIVATYFHADMLNIL